MQLIKHVYPVSISLAATDHGSANLPTAVDQSKSIILPGGLTSSSSGSTSFFNNTGRWLWNSTSQVGFQKSTSAVNTAIATATVIEFNSNVNVTTDIVTVTAGNLTGTKTFGAVSALAFVFSLGIEPTASSGGYTAALGVGIVLTNPTTVTATIGVALATDIKVGFMVVDFDATVVESVEQITPPSDATAGTSFAYTLGTSVDMTRSLSFNNGMSNSTTIAASANVAYRHALTAGNTLTFTRSGNGTASTRTVYGVVVQFRRGVSVQRGVLPGDGVSGSPSAALGASVDVARSWVQFDGQSGVGNCDSAMQNLALTSTLVQGAVRVSPSNAGAVSSWQVAQWDSIPIPRIIQAGQALNRSAVI